MTEEELEKRRASRRISTAKYRTTENGKKKTKEYSKKYAKRNLENVKKWRTTDKGKKYTKEYTEKNAERQRQKSKEWYEKNKEKVKVRSAIRYLNDKDRIYKKKVQYIKANPDKKKEYNRRATEKGTNELRDYYIKRLLAKDLNGNKKTIEQKKREVLKKRVKKVLKKLDDEKQN